jgi:hypothetical protein
LLEKLNKMAERMKRQEQNDHPLIEHDAVGDGAKVH